MNKGNMKLIVAKYKWQLLAGLSGIIFVLIALVFTGKNGYDIPNKWVSGSSEIIPLQVRDSISRTVDSDKVLVLVIPGKLKPSYLVNLNSNAFCGTGGCIYHIFNENGDVTLSLLIDAALPKGFDSLIVSGSDKTKECFGILQAASETAVTRNEYCKQDGKFFLINTFVEELNTKNGKNNEEPPKKPSPTPTSTSKAI
jgi:hypothetical protein